MYEIMCNATLVSKSSCRLMIFWCSKNPKDARQLLPAVQYPVIRNEHPFIDCFEEQSIPFLNIFKNKQASAVWSLPGPGDLLHEGEEVGLRVNRSLTTMHKPRALFAIEVNFKSYVFIDY
jgi:hypothetical protein